MSGQSRVETRDGLSLGTEVIRPSITFSLRQVHPITLLHPQGRWKTWVDIEEEEEEEERRDKRRGMEWNMKEEEESGSEKEGERQQQKSGISSFVKKATLVTSSQLRQQSLCGGRRLGDSKWLLSTAG